MRKLFLFLVLLIFSFELEAQKFSGGEIYYEQLSYRKYKITAQVYRVCSDSSLNSLNGFVISDSFKTSMNFKRVSIARINDTCGNPCNVQNQSSNPGFEKHIFIDTVDFNKAPFNKYVKAGNCFVNFAIQQYRRDSSSNIKSSGNNLFYIESKVNICFNITKNKSPEFAFEPKFYTCCNQPFIYNMGIIDSSDVDSLALELAPVLSDFATSVQYNGSFNSQIPMTPYCPPSPGVINCRALPNAKPPRGFYFDKETGDINFTPTNCYEIGVIKVLVSEYRKDSTNKFVLLGQVSREMQVKVKICSDNNPPYFTGSSKYSVCENNQICFTIGTKDEPFLPYQTTYDTVKVDWNHGIPGSSCNVVDPSAREKELKFCWKTPVTQKMTYNRFGVVAYDKQCNIGMSSRGYFITKKPIATNKRIYTQSKCHQLKYQIFPNDTLNVPFKNYVYTVNIASVNSPTSNIFTSYKQTDSFSAPKSGQYIIKTYCNYPGLNCPVNTIDTITLHVAKAIAVNSKDTLVCQYDSIRLSPYNDDFSQFKFKWYDSEIGQQVADTNMVYMSRQNSLRKTVRYELRHQNGCLYKDSVQIISRGAFTLTPDNHILNLCMGVDDTLKVSNISGQAPFTYEWTINGQLKSSSNQLALRLYNDAFVKVRVSDAYNCPAEDTINIKSIPLPKIQMTDTTGCLNDTITISSRLSQYYPNLDYKWYLDHQLSSITGSDFRWVVKGNQTLELKLGSTNACKTQKMITCNFLPLPVVSILGDTIFNKAHYIQLSSDKVFTRYSWSNGSTTKDNGFWAYTLGAPGKYNIRLEVTDSNGCKSEAVHSFRTNGLTDVNTSAKTQWQIYPNPGSDIVNIIAPENGILKLYSAEGKLIKTFSVAEGMNKADVSDLSAGYYLLQCGSFRSTLLIE